MSITVEADFDWQVEKDNGAAKIKVANEKAFVESAKKAGIEKKTLESVAKFQEAYLHNAVEESIAKAEEVFKGDKDLTEAEASVPFGVGKSSKIVTHVLREKTFKIPGTDKTVTKPVIKTWVEAHAFNYPKSKRKELENKLKDALLK